MVYDLNSEAVYARFGLLRHRERERERERERGRGRERKMFSLHKACVISGFRRNINEIFALLACYAALIDS
jgi:hypothetical protein